MSEYIGLDMPLKEAALSVRRDRKRIWRGKCPSGPSLVVSLRGCN
ncbi:transposase (fragment) [Mesorhizobium delmotii]|uniref:Transposase n=1 Tax=Mesorhizobium delmotii TaxID=1631247 RepID=A0A2P9AE69_9HYPH